MSEHFKHELERNKAILAALIMMSTADNEFEPMESDFLRNVANQLHIPNDDVDLILSDPQKYKLDIPKGEEDRMTILYYLLFAMKADGVIREAGRGVML